MAGFSVQTNAMETAAENMKACAGKMTEISAAVRSVSGNLQIKSDASGQIRRALQIAACNIESLKKDIQTVSETLQNAKNMYSQTENRILDRVSYKSGDSGVSELKLEDFWRGIINWFRSWFHLRPIVDEYEIDTIVFDDKGSYGGNQGSPKNEKDTKQRQELYNMIRARFPEENLTEEELSDYLEKLNSEGCGYVAVVNTIFRHFEGREDEFRDTFGYDMYGDDGDLNFDMLLVDIYTSKDNVLPGGTYDSLHDYDPQKDSPADSYDLWSDTTGTGLTPSETEYVLESFMQEHGENVNVSSGQSFTAEEIQQRLENGEDVMIFYHYGKIYTEDGATHDINGGHGMIVTGVTEEGELIVSSWGEKYYLDPDEVYTFTDRNGTTHTTTMNYSTINYE